MTDNITDALRFSCAWGALDDARTISEEPKDTRLIFVVGEREKQFGL